MKQRRSTGEQLWNSNTKYALGLYKTLGEALGIWPKESHELSSYIRVASITIIELWMSTSLIKQLIIQGNCGVVTEMVDVLSAIICATLTVFKVVLPKIHSHEMKVIIDSAVEDWAKYVNGESRDIMLRFAKIGRIVFFTQIIGAYIVVIPMIFVRLPFIPTFGNDQPNQSVTVQNLPIGPSCWVSSDAPTFHYVANYVFQSIQLFIIGIGYIGGDTFFFGIAMHVCGQFELLYTCMKSLRGVKDRRLQRRIIKQFSSRHNHLLILGNYFEKIYNLIILVQVGADTLLTCITGIILLMSVQSADSFLIAGLSMRIYLVYIQLFMYSYVGEELSSQNEKLRLAIYNSPWYDMPPDLVRSMSFIIRRCAYPFNLTAGKIYPMNIANFKNILKTMTSYFSILRLMLIDEQK